MIPYPQPNVKVQEKDMILKQTADNVISPVLISFVWWVLTEAERSGTKRLYFLSRDGYVMYRIAERFREYFHLETELRYLYSSRIAWRTAVYNLIDGDEKYRYIFSGGYRITPRIILKRVQADSSQRLRIYEDIGFHADENQELNAKGLKIFKEKLKSSAVFSEYLHYISERQLENTANYLKQEGVFDGGEIVLVDSGWTGTVQRNLRQIAETAVQKPKITGYYFGLYTHSADAKDGKYNAWYFSPDSPVHIMTSFNNNVFECMCATPFDMTCGYEYSREYGCYCPIFNRTNDFNKQKAVLLNSCIEDCTADFFRKNKLNFEDYSGKYLEQSRVILQRFMMNPSEEEAHTLGEFRFCDDASDCYENSLTRFIDESCLRNYNIFTRLIYKFTAVDNADLFWLHGSAAMSKIDKNIDWYKLNYRLWETMRLAVKKYKLKLKRLKKDKNVGSY